MGSAFAVVGETLIDVVYREGGDVDEVPGGSPANVALALGRLGCEVTLHTALADDVRGAVLQQWLRAAGVEVASHQIARTSTAVARLSGDGSAHYEFDIDWTLGRVEVNPGVVHVHVGSVGSWLRPGADVVAEYVRAIGRAATISFDPNIRPALIDDAESARTRCEALAFASDVIKLSDEDLAWLYPTRTELSVVTEWLDAGAAVVVVTEGASGSRAYTRGGELVAVPAQAANVVDTIGAGDTFMGVFLASLRELGYLGPRNRGHLSHISARSLRAAVMRATDAACVTVSRAGMNPPTASELESAEEYLARASSVEAQS